MPRRRSTLPPDVLRIYENLESFYDEQDSLGRKWCNAICGVYCFYDYDGEPIYVGQTLEQLRRRIGRHLTNQRTDAVAMSVLDPLEVADIEVWPFWNLEQFDPVTRRSRISDRAIAVQMINAAEYTVYDSVKARSVIGEVLNEIIPPEAEFIELPPSVRRTIVPTEIRERLGHKDTRIAQRADTIARLAKVMTRRDASLGLRHTLIVQAKRLQLLAESRYSEVRGETPPEEVIAETIGIEQEAAEATQL